NGPTCLGRQVYPLFMKRVVVCAAFIFASSSSTVGSARPATSPSGAHPAASPYALNQLHCGFISLTSPRYGSHIRSTSGQAGKSLEVFGTTLRGENGRFAPS